MSDSSIVIIQGTVGLYTVATRCHTCFAVTLKYTEDSSLTILRHSLILPFIILAYVGFWSYLEPGYICILIQYMKVVIRRNPVQRFVS